MDNNSSDENDQRSVQFVTPPPSDDEQGSVNVQKIFLGDAYEQLDEDAQEALQHVSNVDLNLDLIKPEDTTQQQRQVFGKEESKGGESGAGGTTPAGAAKTAPQSEVSKGGDQEADGGADEDGEDLDSSEHYSLSEDVQVDLDGMVQFKLVKGDPNEYDVNVLQFSKLFLPDTKKRQKQMENYNRREIGEVIEFEDLKYRQRRRDLKETYKKSQMAHLRKSKYLPVNPFLEDFYYLQGFSKSGNAPQSNKKPQVLQGYKPLFSLHGSTSKLADYHNLERILPSSAQRQSLTRPELALQQRRALQASKQQNNQFSDAKKEAEITRNEIEQRQKDYTLEACQINEIKSQIKKGINSSLKNKGEAKGKRSIVRYEEDSEQIAELRSKIKQAKVTLNRSLEQKIPQKRVKKVERQAFAMLSKLNSIYSSDAPQKQQKQPTTARSIQKMQQDHNKLPTEVDIYEIQVAEKFKKCGVPTKRVKFWGELEDSVTEHQMSKDAYMIKKQEWVQFVKNKQTYKQPIFQLIASSKHSSQNDAQASQNQANKDQAALKLQQSLIPPGLFNKPGMPGNPNAMVHPLLRPLNPEQAQGNQPGGQAAPVRAANRRTTQPVVDKSDFDLVTSFDEYEKLKKQEAMYYRQRKKTVVTAESIMRHVRWKMGRISDKDFYREELQEMQQDDKIKQPHRQMPQRRHMGSNNPPTDLTEAEPKDLESSKKHRTIPIDFEENLDSHFERKRVEIQERILRLKGEKERASQQKQNTTQTPAYEPIVSVDHKESEEDHHASDQNKNHSDNDSSSSDSDSDDDEAVSMQNQRGAGHSMLPSIADELNHAQCIKDLSFFKLNWDDNDLQTFHRPNIQNYFKDQSNNGKMPAVAVSTKKEDKETRLNPHLYFKTRFKLSLTKGKFCIFEHIDQHPLFVNNFGMASRLKRYYYGDKQPTKKEFLNQKHENVANRHIGPYGKFMLKQRLEKLDLLGQVDQQRYKGLTMLENNMYNAPVFYHRMPSTNNDFYCSVIKQGNNESRIIIRQLNSFYTVGQIEPKREVYNPQSRHFTHFIKQQSKAYTTRLLQENKVMSFQDIRQFFPLIGSPIIKKGLKEIQVEQDRNGLCRLNANFEMERHKDRMTPEMICQFESARHGQYRLERIGISEILSADKISYSTHKFCFEETDLVLQRVAKLIESEVLQTPWNLSSNYIKIKQEGSMMMLEGQGDPSYGHGGYSYLKMPLKISADSIQGAKANRMNLNPAIQNPKAVTGTEADLRKLKKLQLYDILLEAGVQESELVVKTRWEMVALLRCFASQQMPQSQLGQNGQAMKSFYARGVRNTSRKQQEMYNKRADHTFRKQMDTLANPNPPKELHEQSEDEPDFTQLPDLDAMGLEKIGKGFGTSLNKPKKQKDLQESEDQDDMSPSANASKQQQQALMLREPGENAKDFTRDIYILVNDESRKQIVEVEVMPEIKKIEDIKDYLKLFLVTNPHALSPQNSNPSGINIGGVSSNAEFLYAMNGNGSKEWEKKLREKLESGEIPKKIKILCHKIRSLTKEDGQNYGEGDADYFDCHENRKYERIIFCADEKQIKKFSRCMHKNNQRAPRRTTRRNLTKAYRPLTNENLKLQAEKNKQPGAPSSNVRSTSRSLTSQNLGTKRSVTHGPPQLGTLRQSAEKSKNYRKDQGSSSIYSQNLMKDATGKVKVAIGGQGLQQQQSSRNLQSSGQKSHNKKRSNKPVSATPPPMRINITNNGVLMQPSALPVITNMNTNALNVDHQQQLQQNQAANLQLQSSSILSEQAAVKPIQIVALAGSDKNNNFMSQLTTSNNLDLQQPPSSSQQNVIAKDSTILQSKVSLNIFGGTTGTVQPMPNSQPTPLIGFNQNSSNLLVQQQQQSTTVNPEQIGDNRIDIDQVMDNQEQRLVIQHQQQQPEQQQQSIEEIKLDTNGSVVQQQQQQQMHQETMERNGGEDDDNNELVNNHNEDLSMDGSEFEPDRVTPQEDEDEDDEEDSSDYNDINQLQNDGGHHQILQRKNTMQSQNSQKHIAQPKIIKRSSTSLTGGRYNAMIQQPSYSRKGSVKSNSRSRKGQSSTQKFKPHGFGNEDFEYQHLTANKSRRRQQQDGTLSLNNIFMEIIDILSDQEGAYLFHNQPTRQDAPNYRDHIRNPIALKDLKNKSKRNEYKDRDGFLADLALMVDNCEKFNGTVHWITNIAKTLEQRAIKEIDGKRGDIETMECVIKMDGL